MSYLLRGLVVDGTTNEVLPSATVQILSLNKITSTDVNGYFAIRIDTSAFKSGFLEIYVTYIGYQSASVNFSIDEIANGIISITLKRETQQFDNIYVYGANERSVDKTQMSFVRMPVMMLESLPSFLGQADVLRVIQSFPGVSAGIEGTTGFFVRGGSLDQSLFLLDGAPIYSPFHSSGFVSLFPSSIIRNVDFYSGSFPAHYGGRLSSILDISTKNPSGDKSTGEVQLGVLSANFSLYTPLIKKWNIGLGFRKSMFVDRFEKNRWNSDGPGIPSNPFYDLHATLFKQITNVGYVKFSAFIGNDKFESIQSENSFGGNRVFINQNGNIITKKNIALSGNVLYNRSIHTIEATAYLSRYTENQQQFNSLNVTERGTDILAQRNELSSKNNIQETGFGLNITSDVFSWIDFKYGAKVSHFNFNPTITQKAELFSESSDPIQNTLVSTNSFMSYEGFFSIDLRFLKRLFLDVGIRSSTYTNFLGNPHILQPRTSARLKISNNFAIKAAYSAITQPFHLLSTSGFGVNSDLWIASNSANPIERSDILTVGFTISKSDVDFTLEVYDKKMYNLVEYSTGSFFLDTEAVLDDLISQGSGKSKGVEVLVMKKTGRVSGWLSYTYSETSREFDNINQGNRFRFTYDRPHIANANFRLMITKKLDFSTNFVFQSGHLVTLPEGRFQGSVDNPLVIGPQHVFFIVADRNNYRLPDYHRMDVSLTYSLSQSRNIDLSAGVYNVYNRANVVDGALTYNAGVDGVYIVEVSYNYLFPAIPYFSLKWEF